MLVLLGLSALAVFLTKTFPCREVGKLLACIRLATGRWKTTGEDWTRHRAVTEGEKSPMASSMRNDPIPKSQWWESQEMADYIKASVLSQVGEKENYL